MFLTFKKWVKNIQTAGYNGACMLIENKAVSDVGIFSQYKLDSIDH